MTTVGVIGLGKMGLPIAQNLMDRGLNVVGYRRSGTSDLTALGGTGAQSPADVASASDVLLSILPDVAALREVLLGSQGTMTKLRPGTVHVEMSTLDVAEKAALRDHVRSAGGDLLDCPISGTPAMVRPRAATTFVSGEKASVDAVREVLDAISGPWVYTGAFGTAARLKYVASLLVAQGAERQRDLAIRLAMGAGRGRVVRGRLGSYQRGLANARKARQKTGRTPSR